MIDDVFLIKIFEQLSEKRKETQTVVTRRFVQIDRSLAETLTQGGSEWGGNDGAVLQW